MLKNVSAGIDSVPDVVVKPVMPSWAVAVHVNVTPSVGLDKVTGTVVSPLVINWSSSENSTRGEGFTVIENVSDSPSQLTSLYVYTDVTVIFAEIAPVVPFVATKLEIAPSPLAASPMFVLSFNQE